MQLYIHIIENSATEYPTVQLHIPTFRQGKAMQNDVMKTVYLILYSSSNIEQDLWVSTQSIYSLW